jgi:hypothetical protein
MDESGNGRGSRLHRDPDGDGDGAQLELSGDDDGDAPPAFAGAGSRPQRSGAAGRSRAKAREKELAEAGQYELKFLVRVEDLEQLVVTGDISEDDIQTPARRSAAVAELLPDLARRHAKHLEEQQREPSSLYALALAGSRTPVGEATLVDLEIARHHLRDQALELAGWDGVDSSDRARAGGGKTVQEVLDLEQLRVMHRLGRPR